MTMENKRRSPRLAPKAGTHIVYIEGSAAIKDLSMTGMYVLDPEPLDEGSQIKFALRVGTEDINLKGIVSRTVPGEGMVIQFKDISLVAKHRLETYMAALNATPGVPKKG